MRIKTIAATAALTAATAVPFITTSGVGADAPAPAMIRVSNSYTYDAGHNMPVTVCLDGAQLSSLDTTETTGPFSVDPGTHSIMVLSGENTPCNTEGGIDRTMDFASGETSTLVTLWDSETGLAIVSRPDDLSCTQPGEGRVVIRQMGTFWYMDALAAVDVKSGSETLASGLYLGDQDINSNVDAGTIATPTVFAAGTTASLMNTPNLPVTEGFVIVRTLFGGSDGSTGSYDNRIEVGLCDTATTTTTTLAPTSTVAPTTTVAKTAPAAATPVKTTPTYTG